MAVGQIMVHSSCLMHTGAAKYVSVEAGTSAAEDCDPHTDTVA